MNPRDSAPMLDATATITTVLRRGGISFDCTRRRCVYRDRTIVLAPREFRIMRELMLRAGEAVSDHDLALAYTDNGLPTAFPNVWSCMQRLRNKIQAVAGRCLIRRAHRVGFQID